MNDLSVAKIAELVDYSATYYPQHIEKQPNWAVLHYILIIDQDHSSQSLALLIDTFTMLA